MSFKVIKYLMQTINGLHKASTVLYGSMIVTRLSIRFLGPNDVYAYIKTFVDCSKKQFIKSLTYEICFIKGFDT